MAELSEHMNVINVFHDVNSTFYKVPRIHRNPGFFNLIIVFIVKIEPYSRKDTKKDKKLPETRS